jgi:hypothetical protein
MADRVVLHVGTMKSGTTYLQGVLEALASRDPGAAAYYVGGTFDAQTEAVRGLIQPPGQRRPARWRQLVAESLARPGTAIWSQELLSMAAPGRVAGIVGSYEGVPVDVVVTVRDQHRALPAQWQSYVRNRGEDDWPTYLRRVAAAVDGHDDGSKAVRSFRRAQDVPAILARWSGVAGVAGVAVVVVPPATAEPEELWRRFCAAARIDVPAVPPVAADRANVSLGHASCDAWRRVNPALEPLDKDTFTLAREALLDGLLDLRESEARPVLDRAGTALARRLNADVVEAVDRLGARVVGSLDELPRDPDPGADPVPDEVPAPDPAQVRRALAAAWAACVPGTAVPPGDLDELARALGEALVRRFG